MPENSPIPTPLSEMTPQQRMDYDAEKKAYTQLTQVLPRTVYHQFAQCKTTYEMWTSIELRIEGDLKMRQAKLALIKREFEAFCHI